MPATLPNPRRPTAVRARQLPWTRLSDDELLRLRVCDLRRDRGRSPPPRPASAPSAARKRAPPASRHHVQHLGEWYAQSHPTEDFAETFAVWLAPRSGWQRRYASSPALRQLRFVQQMAGEF